MCVYVTVYISTSLYVCLSLHVSLYLCFSPCLSVSVYPSHTNVSYPSHCYYSHLFLSQLSSHFRLFGHMLARASLKFEQERLQVCCKIGYLYFYVSCSFLPSFLHIFLCLFSSLFFLFLISYLSLLIFLFPPLRNLCQGR